MVIDIGTTSSIGELLDMITAKNVAVYAKVSGKTEITSLGILARTFVWYRVALPKIPGMARVLFNRTV